MFLINNYGNLQQNLSPIKVFALWVYLSWFIIQAAIVWHVVCPWPMIRAITRDDIVAWWFGHLKVTWTSSLRHAPVVTLQLNVIVILLLFMPGKVGAYFHQAGKTSFWMVTLNTDYYPCVVVYYAWEGGNVGSLFLLPFVAVVRHMHTHAVDHAHVHTLRLGGAIAWGTSTDIGTSLNVIQRLNWSTCRFLKMIFTPNQWVLWLVQNQSLKELFKQTKN